MSVSSLKQKKGWRKVLMHVDTVASPARAWQLQSYSYITVTELQLHQVSSISELFQSTEGGTEDGSQIKAVLARWFGEA